jgi:hypothetical protein
MGLLDRLAPRKPESEARPHTPAASNGDSVFATKALRKFLSSLTAKPLPVLLDLGPVVGSNVTFFGERLGCKIFVEDIFADLDRHVRTGTAAAFPAFLQTRFKQASTTVDGILCWDLFDYIDKKAAQALATELTRLLAPDGALLAFFGSQQSAQARASRYTKYIVVDDLNLKYRPYPAVRGPQSALPNRDILKMFERLRVADSFLLQNNQREILFRKPLELAL